MKDIARFSAIINNEPGITQAQLAKKYSDISPSTVARTLKRLGYTRKKSFIYRERSEKKRKYFLTRLSKVPPENIVYVGESGFDNAARVSYGYSPRGQRCPESVRSRTSSRITVIAGQRLGETLAPILFEGNTNTAVFTQWLEEFLIPELKRGDKVVMDNTSFHKSRKIRRTLRKVGCGLYYLPPYSPDLNPIERYWSKLKKVHTQKISENDWKNGESLSESFRKCSSLID